MTILGVLRSQVTHGYLYTPPGSVLVFFPFPLRRSLSTCHDAPRDSTLKKRSYNTKPGRYMTSKGHLFLRAKAKVTFWTKTLTDLGLPLFPL